MKILNNSKLLELFFTWFNLILLIMLCLFELFGLYAVFINKCPQTDNYLYYQCGEGKVYMALLFLVVVPPLILYMGLLYAAFLKSWSIRWWIQGLLALTVLLLIIL